MTAIGRKEKQYTLLMNMQQLEFQKYDGAANDFVIVDLRKQPFDLTEELIAQICHRRRGVGADGLMTLSEGVEGYDFVMHYYNSDGREADMCGNGGRCIAVFAWMQGVKGRGQSDGEVVARYHFLASDGPHDAVILQWDKDSNSGQVQLSMRDVECEGVRKVLDGWLLNTGVPHYVQTVDDIEHYDVVNEGRRIRHLPELGPEGANVNFVHQLDDGRLMVRTYERGVEDETWACGTGVTASAIVTELNRVCTKGGDFRVDYKYGQQRITDVRLTGPVSLNFAGTYAVHN